MLFRKKDPEDPERLKQLVPVRRYTREEVVIFMELARGLINDGLSLIWQSPIVETPLWYRVEVAYDDGTPEHAYETWYFYKQHGGD